jgi:hypothetical protein
MQWIGGIVAGVYSVSRAAQHCVAAAYLENCGRYCRRLAKPESAETFVVAKKHQHIDELIDALVWMRRQESDALDAAAKNNTQVDMDTIARIAMSVLKRLNQSVILRREIGHIGHWTPTVNRCHDNVAIWVAKRPQHKHVRGFIYADLRPYAPFIRLMAHSAVETEDGTLCDITPHQASFDYPFIRHVGTDEEFDLFGRIGHFDLPV